MVKTDTQKKRNNFIALPRLVYLNLLKFYLVIFIEQIRPHYFLLRFYFHAL